MAFSYLEELVGLKEVGSPEVLVGKLFGLDGTENIDSRVSASFESDTDFFVVIHDPSDDELYKLKVELGTGKSKLWTLPNDGTIKVDHPQRPPDSEAVRTVPIDRQVQMPPQGFRMKVQPMVDQSFRNQFGTAVSTRVNAILEHAKTLFKHASLQTKFELDLKPLRNYPGSMKAIDGNLNTFRDHVNGGNGLPLVNTYSLLTSKDGDGIAGIAWLGTVCNSARGMRTNINEYYGDLKTAEILVHEIGHNLNMAHDFGSSPNDPRTSSTGAPCTNVNGYMDYRPNPNKWSPCSVEDITAYYNSIGPNNYKNCMTLLGDDPNPPTTPASTPTPSPTPATTTGGGGTTAAPPGSTGGTASTGWPGWPDSTGGTAATGWPDSSGGTGWTDGGTGWTDGGTGWTDWNSWW